MQGTANCVETSGAKHSGEEWWEGDHLDVAEGKSRGDECDRPERDGSRSIKADSYTIISYAVLAEAP